jgi:hypothetical protein
VLNKLWGRVISREMIERERSIIERERERER